MLRTDFLPRIVDRAIVEDVFTSGRRFFEVPGDGHPNGHQRYAKAGDTPTMPIEFSVAAYRLGHSMVRAAYDWNRIFSGTIASLKLLFIFSGTSGNFNPGEADVNNQESGLFERLPTNWAVDWRRMYDFAGEAGRPDLAGPAGFNVAQRIDTLLVDPLATMPKGTFGGNGTNPPPIQLNLAFRNLIRANMVELASGQQAAAFLGVEPLTAEQVIGGTDAGAVLSALSPDEQTAFATQDAAVVLHPAGGGAERRPAHRRGRPDRGGGLPPGDGGQSHLHRAGPLVASYAGSGRRHVPDGRSAAVRVRGPRRPAGAAR